MAFLITILEMLIELVVVSRFSDGNVENTPTILGRVKLYSQSTIIISIDSDSNCLS